MEPLTGQKLADKMHDLGSKLRERIWVAAPFIGAWHSVKKILGSDLKEARHIRLLTDKHCLSSFSKSTVNRFRETGEIRHINGLHAKVYIFDDQAIVTSANLTETAFTMRTEVGLFLNSAEAKPLIELYKTWWDSHSEEIPLDFVFPQPKDLGNFEKQEYTGSGLKKHSILHPIKKPNGPGDGEYNIFLEHYKELASIYSEVQKPRIWQGSTLYFEIDTFLDYLLHHNGKPSKGYRGNVSPRPLDSAGRKKEISKWAAEFKKWAINKKQTKDKDSKMIQKLLNPNNINQITIKDVQEIVGKLECLKRDRGHKKIIMAFAKENLEHIKLGWKTLLHQTELSPDQRINQIKLPHFGKSSKQELLGFYYPKEFPLRNSNTNAGLRFLGYKVSD